LAAGDAADEVEISVEEVVGGERERMFPEDLLEGYGAGLALEGLDAVEEQGERDASGEAVLVAGAFWADDGLDAEFFAQFAAEGLLGGLTRLDFAAGEFPLEAVAVVGHALPDEDFALALEDACDDDGCASHAGWRRMNRELPFIAQ